MIESLAAKTVSKHNLEKDNNDSVSKTREYISKVKEHLEAKEKFERVEIPEILKDKKILGQAFVSGGKHVFVAETTAFELGNYGEQGVGKRYSDEAFLIYDENGQEAGRLAISHEVDHISIDWMDSSKSADINLSGVGQLIHQLAVEKSYIDGHHGNVHLRSLQSASTFHYKEGYKTTQSDQYRQNKDDKWVKRNSEDGYYQSENFKYNLDNSNETDQITRDFLINGDKRQTLINGHNSRPIDEFPMRLSEHGDSITAIDTDTDEKYFVTKDKYKEWLEKKGQVEKSKAYYIYAIKKNPILDSIVKGLDDDTLIID